MTKPRRQSLKQFQALQRFAASYIMQPLAPGFRSSKNFIDGRPNRQVAETFVKANDRLTAFERVEIYNKQYWFRLIDCMYDDYPGLATLLGRLKFNKLVAAYLTANPSRSFTLRNLGSRLVKFITDHPELTAGKTDLCQEMAAFEWAQVVAFDGPEKPPVPLEDLIAAKPTKLKLSLQPYITLMHLHWELDEFTIAVKRSAMRGEASNAVDSPSERKESPKPPRPKKAEIFLAVHRLDNDLYYKRLEKPAYLLLSHLEKGKSLSAAVTTVMNAMPNTDWTASLQSWFSNWSELGWLCKRH
jgi:hypothetical protein